MAQFKSRLPHVEAVQWQPDPKLGTFDGERFGNRRIGVDALGVEYTIQDIGLRTGGRYQKIKPGDWIVNLGFSVVMVVPDGVFRSLYDPV